MDDSTFLYKELANQDRKKKFFKFNIKIENINLSIEGTDLGILLYGLGFAFVGALFCFSTNPIMQNSIDFYSDFERMALIFLVFHFTINHRRYIINEELLNLEKNNSFNFQGDYKSKQYSFLNFKSLNIHTIFYGFLMILISLVILVVCNVAINLSIMLTHGGFDIFKFINTYDFKINLLLQITRTILIEELVYRGLILILISFIFKKIVKLRADFSDIISIIISGVSFGYIHIFRYGSVGPVVYLMILGGLCAYLTLNKGIWAGMTLHIINNLIASFQGYFLDQNSQSLYSIILIIFLILTILLMYYFSKKFKNSMLHFGCISIFMIISFSIAYFTNGLIRSEDFGGIYFEHFHIIYFIPIIYILFKNKYSSRRFIFSILIGICLGVFISDYFDIINQSLIQWAYTLFYAFQFIMIYAIFNHYLFIKKKRKMEL